MKAQIQGIDCVGVPEFRTWAPPNLDAVYLQVELSIGTPEGKAADLFQIHIATPQAIAGRPERRAGKLMVVQRFDWAEIEATLRKWVAEVSGDTWEELAGQLGRRFDWEYRGYPR